MLNILNGLGTSLLGNAADLPSSVDEVQATPDLTTLFIILGCVFVAGITAYVIVKVRLNAKHEQEILERGLRTGIPHIKSLDNNLPANSLNSLYDNDKGGKKK